jgi:hypothetical protein
MVRDRGRHSLEAGAETRIHEQEVKKTKPNEKRKERKRKSKKKEENESSK